MSQMTLLQEDNRQIFDSHYEIPFNQIWSKVENRRSIKEMLTRNQNMIDPQNSDKTKSRDVNGNPGLNGHNCLICGKPGNPTNQVFFQRQK